MNALVVLIINSRRLMLSSKNKNLLENEQRDFEDNSTLVSIVTEGTEIVCDVARDTKEKVFQAMGLKN